MKNKLLTLTAALVSTIGANAAISLTTQTAASGTPFDVNISTTDLINQGQATFSSSSTSQSTSFGGAETGNDGVPTSNNDTVYDNNLNGAASLILTYNLNVSVNTLGYDITSIETFYGYNGSASAFADQIYSIEYALAGSPATYTGLTSVNFNPATSVAASQITITEDTTGVLASGVSSIRFLLSPNPANSQVGIAREFDVVGTPTGVVPEPSAAILGGLGMLTLLRRRRA